MTDRPVAVFICSRGTKWHRCSSCARRAERQCDFPLTGVQAGKTCDRWICAWCAKTVGPNLDYCRVHAGAPPAVAVAATTKPRTALVVHTARVSTADPDRLDITRQSGTEGLFLAPSWGILTPALRALRSDDLDERNAGWARYVAAYRLEMLTSYKTHRGQWQLLLALPRVVLACVCVDPDHCHRAILRTQILPRLGATDGGELPGKRTKGESTTGDLFSGRTGKDEHQDG